MPNCRTARRHLEMWQSKWQMVFNPSKCKTICISTKKVPHKENTFFCGIELEHVECISCLGVLLNEDLKWSKHVTSVSGKASKVLGVIKRNLWNYPNNVKITAYTAIVCPKLEYACAAWDTYLQKDIALLERIQRKAARFCSNNYHPTASVTEMLQDLGWTSLELRRTMIRLNLLYKMSRKQNDIDVNNYLQPHSEVRTLGSHRYRRRQDKATKNTYFYSFFPRTIRLWNTLPAEIVESNSLAVFNSKLLLYLVKNY